MFYFYSTLIYLAHEIVDNHLAPCVMSCLWVQIVHRAPGPRVWVLTPSPRTLQSSPVGLWAPPTIVSLPPHQSDVIACRPAVIPLDSANLHLDSQQWSRLSQPKNHLIYPGLLRVDVYAVTHDVIANHDILVKPRSVDIRWVIKAIASHPRLVRLGFHVSI